MAAASVSRTLRASFRSATEFHPGVLDDSVDGPQPVEQRLQFVELQGVLCVAPRLRRLFVHLEEQAVDTGRNACGRERFDVLSETSGDAVAAARQLQAVGHVEDDGAAE